MTNDSEQCPSDFRRTGEILMEFPQPVKSLKRVGERLFATLEDGTVIDLTELLGEARH